MHPRGWAITDVGQKREHNEDAYLCNDKLRLYAVADGMGGHLGGERASRMAAQILEHEMAARLEAAVEHSAESIAKAMRESTSAAAKAIYDSAQADPEYAGMGTTLTCLCFQGDLLTVCHVGDSRAYLHRDGRARQLTEDHSWIQEQVKAGLLSPDDALVSRFRNIITRSVGFEPTVTPDLASLPVEAGDCYLLCSDGLSNYLTTDEISEVLTSRFYREAGATLVSMANDRGGDDNITCVVIYVANTLVPA